MIWVVEEYDDHIKELVEEVKKQGHKVEFIRYYDMIQDPNYCGTGLPSKFNKDHPDEPVLFYGSIQLAAWIQRYRPEWVPGVWASFEKYRCTQYYGHLGKHLLNQNYRILPVGEVTRLADHLFDTMGQKDSLFIRPDSGTKSFGGKVFERERWEKDWGNATHQMYPTDLVIVAEPQNIDKEYRFVVDNRGFIIAGSQYKDKGSAEIVAGYSDEAYKKCQEVLASGYRPDTMFMVDIGEAHDGCKLIEINAFSSSGLYAADLPSVVRYATEFAQIDYAEFHNIL